MIWRDVRPTPIHVRQFAYLSRGDGSRETFRVPGWGYFEGVEIMLPEPLPMMGNTQVEITIEGRIGGQPFGQWRAHTLHRNLQVIS